jgi:hypothetical protein
MPDMKGEWSYPMMTSIRLYAFSYIWEYICCLSLKIIVLQVWDNRHDYLLRVKISNTDISIVVGC